MPTIAKFDERKLLALLAEDSEYAFQLLFDTHRNTVYRVALLYVKAHNVAEDIVQDVFFKVWFQRKNLGDIESFEAWIFTVTKNLTINRLKKIAHDWNVISKLNREQDSVDNTIDYKMREIECRELLMKAIHELPHQQKKIFMLCKEEGMSYDAVGKLLSISELTVKTHMSRALRALRSFLRDHNSELMLTLLSLELFF